MNIVEKVTVSVTLVSLALLLFGWFWGQMLLHWLSSARCQRRWERLLDDYSYYSACLIVIAGLTAMAGSFVWRLVNWIWS